MKAAVIHQFGEPEVFRYEDVDTPQPGPGNLLLKVLAAGVNRFDHYIREGSVVPALPFPHILGADAAGEVAAVGEGVTGFQVGERVIPMSGYPSSVEDAGIYPNSAAPSFTLTGLGTPGTYAQYLEVPARWVLHDETGLCPEKVATLPMVTATSVRAVKVVGEVQPGDNVLVTAGSSGVGTFEIQVAGALGARVATTVRSPHKVEALRELGADLVINNGEEDLAEAVKTWTNGRGADVVIDNAGGSVLQQAIHAARPQGIIVAVGFLAGTQVRFDIRDFFFAQKQLRGSMSGDIADLRWGLEQIKEGRIRATLDRTLPLSNAAEAHRLVADNAITGNVALLPWAA